LGEIAYFGRAEGALAERMQAEAGKQLAGWYAWLDAALGTNDWFNGASFGWGDLAVAPFVNGAVGFGHTPAEGSGLAAWLTRVNARDSVASCAAAAAAVSFESEAVSLDAVREAVAQGLFKREYRDHRLEWMVKSGGLEIVEAGLRQDNIRFIDPFPAAGAAAS
ncbi:MAG: glutathione S-transferase domain-containing protein, partial [Pseudomonadota bacterium]